MAKKASKRKASRPAKKRARRPSKKTAGSAGIRDRIRELRRVKAADLVPHPMNMQVHPEDQRRATEGMLKELGYADALIARELPGGMLQILDGHLRREITPEVEVPVLLVDLDDAEAELFLATHDPLTRMAEIDPQLQLDLLRTAEPADADARHLIDTMLSAARVAPAEEAKGAEDPHAEESLPNFYHVMIDCADEEEQKATYEKLQAEGRQCRLLTL